MQSHTKYASVNFIARGIKSNAVWGLVIAIGISIFTNIYTIHYIVSLQSELQSLFQRSLLGQNNIQAAQIKLLEIEKDISGLFLAADSHAQSAAEDTIKSNMRGMIILLTKAKQLYRSPKVAASLGAAIKDFSDCETVFDTLATMIRGGKKAAALKFSAGELDRRFDVFDKQLRILNTIKQKRDIKVFKQIDYQLSISVLFAILTVIATIGFRLFLFRRKHGKGKRQRKKAVTLQSSRHIMFDR
ncbi:MAG TPA: hypothetical protein VF335_04315 [Chitinivibrionales bacterium]